MLSIFYGLDLNVPQRPCAEVTVGRNSSSSVAHPGLDSKFSGILRNVGTQEGITGGSGALWGSLGTLAPVPSSLLLSAWISSWKLTTSSILSPGTKTGRATHWSSCKILSQAAVS